MKKVTIEFYMPDEDEVTPINIGKALGVALVTREFYASVEDIIETEEGGEELEERWKRQGER